MIAPLPTNETRRLELLHALNILDTPPENAFDALAARVAAMLDAPIAIVGFIDETRHWFKGKFGTPLQENSREWACCAHTIYAQRTLIAPDIKRDSRFADVPPLLTLGIQAYASAPLMINDCAIGTVCVFDYRVRPFGDHHIQALEDAAQEFGVLLNARRQRLESEGIEHVSALLAPSEPHQNVQAKILERIRREARVSTARAERVGGQLRLQLESAPPEGMRWRAWAMTSSDTAPTPLESFEKASIEMPVPDQARVVMVSLEPRGVFETHPSKIIATFKLF
jgi:GAF domain-containing protein